MTQWEDMLEQDLDWRFEELALLKKQIILQGENPTASKTLLRAIWAMLYAHYEGFCKFALNVCMEQIEQSFEARQQCKEKVLLLSLEGEVRKFRSDTSTNGCFRFFAQTFKSLLAGPVQFERDKKTNEFVIKGESNLYPDLLTENCEDLCLSHSYADQYSKRLWILVDRRNKIAHGRNAVVKDLNEYQEYEDAATAVMYDLALSIIDLLSKKHYLKQPADFEI